MTAEKELTIIQIAALETGQHPIQSQSGRTECWEDGWIAVPPELEQAVWDCLGYCELEITDGVLTGVMPAEVPPPPAEEPSQEERLAALEGAVLAMMGVSSDG